MVQEKLNISSQRCDINLKIGRGDVQKMINDLIELWCGEGGHVTKWLVSIAQNVVYGKLNISS